MPLRPSSLALGMCGIRRIKGMEPLSVFLIVSFISIESFDDRTCDGRRRVIASDHGGCQQANEGVNLEQIHYLAK
jgi:hypothetical protein